VIARVLAYALLYEERLEFGRGISDAEEPALWTHDLTGQLLHWVDVGAPGADRIHLASKKANKVTIVCHKGKEALRREMEGKKVHDSANVDVLYLDSVFVAQLADALERNSSWTVVRTDTELSVTIGEAAFASRIESGTLPV
jgi:uncharacterized protein YaeQ